MQGRDLRERDLQMEKAPKIRKPIDSIRLRNFHFLEKPADKSLLSLVNLFCYEMESISMPKIGAWSLKID